MLPRWPTRPPVTIEVVVPVSDWLNPHLRAALSRSLQAFQRHPRRVAAAALTGMGTLAVTAFGVAPLAAGDVALPAQRMVTEALPLEGLSAQLEQLAEHTLDLHRSTTTRGNDTVDGLLRRLGVADPLASAWLRSDRTARQLLDGDGGKLVQARIGTDGRLLELVARFQPADPAQSATHFSRLTATRSAEGFSTRLDTAALVPQVRLGSGSVRGNLWQAAEDARLPEAVADQMVDIFSGDIDFHRELRRGDSFSVVYETLTADDQPVTWGDGTGRVLAAEYTNRGRRFQAVWFVDPDTGRGAYFSMDGKSRRKPFLASPLEFSRVTSGFAMRMHPVLQSWRAHNGVDYAAPEGTPVKTVGDGTVEFAGRQSGYGNVVQIEHAGGKSTLYAHLSRIDVKQGERVSQGQVLGAVGRTGWATGPHLHFEFRVNGQFQDPLSIAGLTETFKLDADDRPRFRQNAQVAGAQLVAARSMTRFRGDAE